MAPLLSHQCSIMGRVQTSLYAKICGPSSYYLIPIQQSSGQQVLCGMQNMSIWKGNVLVTALVLAKVGSFYVGPIMSYVKFRRKRSISGTLNSQGLDGHIWWFLFQAQGRRGPGHKVYLTSVG